MRARHPNSLGTLAAACAVTRALAWCAAAAVAGCGRSEPGAAPAAAAAGGAALAAPSGLWTSLSADARAALDALEAGAAERALAALARARGDAAPALRLLEARAALGVGDAIGALRAVEAARAAAPLEPEVAATAAEILAAAGRADGAAAEIDAAIARAPRAVSPALLRARGAVWLARGDPLRACEALEAARAADPALPFVVPALVRAHVACGRARLTGPGAAEAGAERELALESAELHADEALALAPLDLTARQLAADVRAARGDLHGALALYEGVVAAGSTGEVGDVARARECAADLHCQAATACLLRRDRPAALDHWRRARELGRPAESLGFGAVALADESRAALERGVERAGAGDWSAAEVAFADAARDAADPMDALDALDRRAAALFELERFGEAAELWADAEARAEAHGCQLAAPLHVNRIKALRNAGRREEARGLAREYLTRHPGGPWRAETEVVLAALERELSLASPAAGADPADRPAD